MKNRKRKLTDYINSLSNIKMFIFLMLCRIPYLVIFYPGLMIYDTGQSLIQAYGIVSDAVLYSTNPTATLTNHHMISLTYLYGGFVRLGDLLGSQNLGFLLYILLQVVVSNLIIVYGLKAIREKANQKTYFWVVIFYMFFPMISIWQITMGKDSLYSAFLMWLAIMLYQIVETKGEITDNLRFNIYMAICSLIIVFSKQQGSYVLIVIAAVLLIVYKKKIIRAFFEMVIPAIFYLFVFTGIILPACNVALSGKQETMGFMFQQTAAAVIDHSDSITVEEKEVISKVLPYDRIEELYNPYTQDSLKFYYNQKSTTAENTDYEITWFKMFFKYPISYIKATCLNIENFFFEGDSTRYMPQLLTENDLLTEREETFDLYNANPFVSLGKTAVLLIARVPLLSSLLKSPFYVWSGIAMILISIKKRKELLIPLIPTILTILLLVITPVEDYRYILPLVYMLPLTIGIFFTGKEKPGSSEKAIS